jgi:hypothetical protein
MIFALAAVLAQDPMQELDELRRDIELYRTINALELKKEQIETIVKLAEDARKAMEEAFPKEDLDALKSALKELRDTLEKGEKPAPEMERRIGELQRSMGEAMRAIGEAQGRLVAKLKETLTEAQWKRLSEMGRPDPLRPMKDQMRGFIDRLREDPNMEFNEELLDRMREGLMRASRPLGLSEKDVDAEADRIGKVIRELFEATGEELAEKKEQYIKRIFEEGRLGEAAKRVPTGGPPEEGNRRIAQTLLNPKVIAALKKRLQ